MMPGRKERGAEHRSGEPNDARPTRVSGSYRRIMGAGLGLGKTGGMGEDDGEIDLELGVGALDVVSVVAPAVAGPPGLIVAGTIQGAKALVKAVQAHQQRQLRAFLRRLDALLPDLEQQTGEPAADALVSAALDSAARAEATRQAEIIAHLLAAGLVGPQDASLTQVLIRLISDLTKAELDALGIFVERREEHASDRRLEDGDAAAILEHTGMPRIVADAVVARLGAAGLLTDLQTYGGTWPSVSELGERLAQAVEEFRDFDASGTLQVDDQAQ